MPLIVPLRRLLPTLLPKTMVTVVDLLRDVSKDQGNLA